MEDIKTTMTKMLPKNMLDFIKEHKLPDEDYKKLIYDTEITDSEFNLIHASQVSKCIENLKQHKAQGKLTIPEWVMDQIVEDHRWIKGWVDDGFIGLNKAWDHLKAVNNYHTKNYGEPYWHASWLFNYDNEMVQSIILKYKLGSRADLKDLKEKLKEKDKITKRFGTYEKFEMDI